MRMGSLRIRKWSRFAAGVTLIFFSINLSAEASSAFVLPQKKNTSAGTPPSEIRVPKKLGTLESKNLAGDSAKPLVIYIQDAHAITDAQKHIQKLLEYFHSTYQIDHVMVEGLSGKMDPTLLRAFPDSFIREKVFGDYFQRGEMTGAEMAAVLSRDALQFEGLEDWDLYEANKEAYLKSAENKPAMEAILRSKRQSLDAERILYYSADQNRLHGLIETVHAKEDALAELLRYLTKFQKETAAYPELNALLKAFLPLKESEQRAFEAELSAAAESFSAKYLQRLSGKKRREFHRKFQLFKTGQLEAGLFAADFSRVNKQAGVRLKKNAKLKRLLKQNVWLKEFRGGKVFEELETFLTGLEEKNAVTSESKILLEKYRDLRLLQKLAALELPRKDYERLEKRTEVYGILSGKERALFEPSRSFYRLAIQRDRAFHENFERSLSRDPSKAVLVLAGGFHAQGFETFLKENHYSYAVVMPAMRSLAGKENYEVLMRGKASWASGTQTSPYDGFMRHASQNLSASLNPLERNLKLKFWRDQILRELALRGNLGEAGKYTKFVEVLLNPGESSGVSAREEKIREALVRVIENYKHRTLDKFQKIFTPQLPAALRPSLLSVSLMKMNPKVLPGKNPAVFRAENRTSDAEHVLFEDEPEKPEFGASVLAKTFGNPEAITKSEFLRFIAGEIEGDSPSGIFDDLGNENSVGQRLHRTLQGLLNRFHHYHYVSQEEMWNDIVIALWEKKEKLAAHLENDRPANAYLNMAVRHWLLDQFRKEKRKLQIYL